MTPADALPFLPFALPDIGEEEIAEVVSCLRSGWVTTGPKTRQFEQEFGAYLGGGIETVSINSATAGLHLALEALGIGPGDEVIVPTMTFTASAEVVRYLGAQPVLVDVDPREGECRELGRGLGAPRQLRGHVPGAAALLPACDALVSSAPEEGFGLAVAEALLAGVPVAAPGLPALRELLPAHPPEAFAA